MTLDVPFSREVNPVGWVIIGESAARIPFSEVRRRSEFNHPHGQRRTPSTRGATTISSRSTSSSTLPLSERTAVSTLAAGRAAGPLAGGTVRAEGDKEVPGNSSVNLCMTKNVPCSKAASHACKLQLCRFQCIDLIELQPADRSKDGSAGGGAVSGFANLRWSATRLAISRELLLHESQGVEVEPPTHKPKSTRGRRPGRLPPPGCTACPSWWQPSARSPPCCPLAGVHRTPSGVLHSTLPAPPDRTKEI